MNYVNNRIYGATIKKGMLCYVNLQAYIYSTRLVLVYFVQSKIRRGQPMSGSWIHSTFQNISLLSKAPWPALGPTQLPVQWIPAAVPLRANARCVQLTITTSSAEVRNEWHQTSAPPYILIDCRATTLHSLLHTALSTYSKLRLPTPIKKNQAPKG